MRDGWTKRKLGDVISLEYGKPLPADQRRTDGGFPAYGANGIKCFAANPYFHDPSIIVGRKGTAGAVNLAEGAFWPLDVTYYVTFDSYQHDLKFLYYMLSALDLPSLATGVKPGINRNVVYAIERYFPPLPEQKRIVAILDEAFAGIATAVANTEKNLANARELFESYLNSVIGGYANKYELTELHRVADFQGGSQPPKSVFLREPRDGYVRLLQIRDFKSDEKAVFIPVSRKNRLCEPSDIMIGRYGASVGQIHTGKGGAYNVALIKATPNKERLNKRYFYYYLLSNLFQQPLASVASRSAQAGFSKEDIARFAVPLPPIREQERAVESFDDLHGQVVRLEKLFESKLSSLNELKQSLLQKAFSGELTAGKAASDAMRQVEEIA